MEEILKMIEEADPADTAKLNEIDARVYFYLYGGKFVKIHSRTVPYIGGKSLTRNYIVYEKNGETEEYSCDSFFEDDWCLGYTRSRDALKAIRPKGWKLYIEEFYNVFSCNLRLMDDVYRVDIHKLPTEELAELYAIIQAIEYERKGAA